MIKCLSSYEIKLNTEVLCSEGKWNMWCKRIKCSFIYINNNNKAQK